VRIVSLGEAGADRWRAEIEAIFFANAGTKSFASEAERDAYRELWLGRYLQHCPEACFVALAPAPDLDRHPGSPKGCPGSREAAQHETADNACGASGVTTAGVAGYLAGSLCSNRDPLLGPDYYALFSPAVIAAHPAHIHVNIRDGLRGRQIGAKLVAAFRTLCVERQVPGFHAVTTAGSGAARFFTQCGMARQAEAEWRGRRVVFLGEGPLRFA
jgi:hypothetical protein